MYVTDGETNATLRRGDTLEAMTLERGLELLAGRRAWEAENGPSPKKSRKNAFIGPFVEKGITDRSISKHLQEGYLSKLDDGRPELIDRRSKIKVKTLVASYHKIQRLTGTFVKDGPTGMRLLTDNECKAIMGFPKTFKIPVSRTQMYRQLGNSVAVPVVTAIAKEILTALVNGLPKQRGKARV